MRASRSAPFARATSSRRRAGFTLIELLIVVVIIGILAMIAIPAFANTRGKANLAKVKSDLRQLATAEEGYYYSNTAYTTDVALLGLATSPGVTINIATATSSGWAATASHPGASPNTCAIFYGSAAAIAPATVEGVLACQ